MLLNYILHPVLTFLVLLTGRLSSIINLLLQKVLKKETENETLNDSRRSTAMSRATLARTDRSWGTYGTNWGSQQML